MALQVIKRMYKQTVYAILVLSLILTNAFSVYAAQTFDEYPLSTGYTHPSQITSGPNGSLWYIQRSSSGNSDTIASMSPSGAVTGAYPMTNPGYTLTTGGSLTIDSSDNIWFHGCARTATSSSWIVGKLDTSTGAVVYYPYGSPYPSSSCSFHLSSAGAMTLGPDGNPWFIHNSNIGSTTRLYSIDPSGVITSKRGWANLRFNEIVVGPDGNVWLGEVGTNNIRKLTYSSTTGHVDSGVTYAVPSAFTGVQSLAAGPDGNVWFTESVPDKVGNVSPSGVFTEYSLASGSGPTNITAGSDGAMWFTNYGSNRIGRITTMGSLTEYSIPTLSSKPDSIVSGPDGAIWFTEKVGKIGRLGY